MDKLEKMKNSCAEFAQDLKTWNVVWEVQPHDYFPFVFKVNTNLGKMQLFLSDRFFCNFAEKSKYLQSTTAKEAAFEALQLVKKEAQKLVDALSVPKGKTAKTKAFENLYKEIISRFHSNEDIAISVMTEPLKSIIIECRKELNSNSESHWVKIDKNNLPKKEVFAVNDWGECLGGMLTKNSIGSIYCESENDKIREPWWYLEYETILKLIPKP